MRDIRGDLQDRASFLEEQINAAQAQFEKRMEQLTLEHRARIDDLRAELEAATTLMEGEYRRLTSDAVEQERRQPAPQPAQQAEPEPQRRPAPEPQQQRGAAPEPQQFHRPPAAEAEPRYRTAPEAPTRHEPQPHRRPVTTEVAPAPAPSPSGEERHDRPAAEPAYQRRPQPAGEADPYRRPAAAEASQPRRPMPATEAAPQHRPIAVEERVAVEEPEQERRTAAPQVYRRAPPAQERGRRPAPVSAQQQPQQPQPRPQQPPLADFLIRKLSEAGAMTLEDLCHLAVRDGYFAEGENPDRSVQVTLMNVVKAGFIRQLPNGTFAPATVMDTIRLRRAI